MWLGVGNCAFGCTCLFYWEEKDNQLKNNPEFIDQQPNDFHDKSVSDIPGNDADRSGSNPNKDSERGGE